MRSLITGGLGQIGSHVAEQLLERGDEVLVIDNLATGRRENLAPAEKLRVEIGCIAERGRVDALIDEFRPEVIVHAAASYKDPDDWEADTRTNVTGTVRLLDAARRHGVRRVIYFQTALCYGTHPPQHPVQLDCPRDPTASSYAISKTTAEDYLVLSGLDFVSFRLANVIGPRNVAGPLPIFFQRLSDGRPCFVTRSRRDFVFVRDLVPVVLAACDGVGAGVYHFSSGSDVAILELYEATARALDLAPIPTPDMRALGPDDAPSILLDPIRTFEDFGPVTFTPLQEMVDAAVADYRANGTGGGHTHLRLDKDS